MSNILSVQIIATLGFLLSFYAWRVERNIRNLKSNYQPACDLTDGISCSRAFGSKYGKLLGVSNALLGMLFYLTVLVLTYFEQFQWIFYLAVLSVFGSVVLGFIQYIRLQTFCLVCTSIYLVNILLFYFSFILIS